MSEHQHDLIALTALYFAAHLQSAVPIVILTEDAGFRARENGKAVKYLSMEEYLVQFWPQLTEMHDLYTSLHAALLSLEASKLEANDDGLIFQPLFLAFFSDFSLQVKFNVSFSGKVQFIRNATTGFFRHKTLDQLEAGVKSDVYLSGPISVSKFRSRTEATVSASSMQDSDVR